MKKWLALIIGLLLSCLLCGCKQPQKDDFSSEEENVKNTYTIQYKCVAEGLFEDIFENMKMPTGNYPTSYVEGEEVIISPLQVYCNEQNTVYAFEGWYYDADCTKLVEDNKLSQNETGDVILYANISKTNKIVQSITYQACLLGEIQEVPMEMFLSNGYYPTSYIVGEETTISNLQDYRVNNNLSYQFKGWYLDSNCTIPLTNNTITNQTEPIVLYANLLMWVKG